MPVVGRLAPTPSGALHLGNALAFAGAWLSARAAGGRVLLRIEDVDTERARPELADAQRADLAWLGLAWDDEVPCQSTRDYAPWLALLGEHTYRCVCTRREIRAAGGTYPGTCRAAGHAHGAVRLRLPDVPAIGFTDRRWGHLAVPPSELGDPVLVRRDGLVGYLLAVVADDLTDGVTEVVRGADLLQPTACQVALWAALGATPPTWLHTPLVLGPDGRKLSKSHGSLELAALRQAGWTADDVWRAIAPWLGLAGVDHLHDAVAAFDPAAGPRGPLILELPDDRVPPPSEGLRWRTLPPGPMAAD